MNEIEKMYKNAGVEKITITYYCNIRENEDCPHENDNILCKECAWGKPMLKYPPFTAEKQLELIKWLVQNKRLCVRKAEHSNNFYMDTIIDRSNGVDNKIFEVCLASQINNLWQDLTEQERKQIKDILE